MLSWRWIEVSTKLHVKSVLKQQLQINDKLITTPVLRLNGTRNWCWMQVKGSIWWWWIEAPKKQFGSYDLEAKHTPRLQDKRMHIASTVIVMCHASVTTGYMNVQLWQSIICASEPTYPMNRNILEENNFPRLWCTHKWRSNIKISRFCFGGTLSPFRDWMTAMLGGQHNMWV